MAADVNTRSMNTFPAQPENSGAPRGEPAETQSESTVTLVWPRAAAAVAGLAVALSFAGFATAGTGQQQPVDQATVAQGVAR